ncbi:uridine kinase [Leifsonia psychrotolerans]|uniref:Uridine kinase n=1 Tax=Glaciibacter psychrotolerans TaxID=670054 RepID=A0A7Z0EDW0_9MICO|nr:uridine kinase [Leifsonia psychrotolerans]
MTATLWSAVRALPDAGVMLIDGPSGAGKSTLADQLLAQWPGSRRPTLVRLDDIYPGWAGLDAGILHLNRFLLHPRSLGAEAAWQRFDWSKEAPGEWTTVEGTRPLIVEGCGAMAAANAPLAQVRVWIDADDRVRKQRALDRDGEVFRAHWDEWDSEWAEYVNRDRPARRATIRFSSTEKA